MFMLSRPLKIADQALPLTFKGSGVGMICGAADVAAVTTFCIIAGSLLLWMVCASKLLLANLSGAKDI